MSALKNFLKIEAASGIVLFLATIVALFLANSSFSDSYTHFLHLSILGLSVHQWVNDGLMTIFFFVVGMEIKKELIVGELSSIKKAALPIIVAVGGMIAPAAIYAYFNSSTNTMSGWGIPMATDIAFALGILSLFGRRVPVSLKIFLLALAIVDDLGAVLVIAIFYTKQISFSYLISAVLAILIILVARKIKIQNYVIYTVLGFFVWFFTLRSGVHATVAGVVLGFLTPLKFITKKNEVISPLQFLIELLHTKVSFIIMPIFAFTNAGLDFRNISILEQSSHPVFQGVFWGLLAGKIIGIFSVSFLAVKLRLAVLPRDANWLQVLGVAALGGVGFTMALFISELALPVESAAQSKMAIFTGSFISAILGAIILSFSKIRPKLSE